MHKIFLFALIFLCATAFRQQQSGISGFRLTGPTGWKEIKNQDILDNIGKYKTTGIEINKYLSDHKGSVLLMSYMKYNPVEHAGLIPIIQVNIRSNTTKNFSQFKEVMTNSANDMKNYLHDFEYIDAPRTVIIDKQVSVYFSARFTMLNKRGDTIKARSRTYGIPAGSRFLQVNFTDGPEEDCSALYDSLVKTIRLHE